MTRRLIAVLATLGTIGCTRDIAGPVDGPYVGLHVVGNVRTVDGNPVAGATLEVWARSPGTCTGTFVEGRAAITNASGEFSRDLSTWNVPRDVCLWIAVTPPVGSALAPATLTFQPARLEIAPDTIDVSIVLNVPSAP